MVEIHYEWNDMCCKICGRYNRDGKCDYNGIQDEINLCKLFYPKGLPEKFRQMWLDYQQRWVIEGQK